MVVRHTLKGTIYERAAIVMKPSSRHSARFTPLGQCLAPNSASLLITSEINRFP
jgi:hypothetical protein